MSMRALLADWDAVRNVEERGRRSHGYSDQGLDGVAERESQFQRRMHAWLLENFVRSDLSQKIKGSIDSRRLNVHVVWTKEYEYVLEC